MNIYFDKGLDLKLEGSLESYVTTITPPKVCAVTPDDFPGFVPKPDVAPGDRVLAGDAVLHNKLYPEMKLVATANGRVKAIVRGERRKILRVEIECEEDYLFRTFDLSEYRDELEALAQSGLLAAFRTRPFDRVVDPNVKPVNIFINGVETAPMTLPYAAHAMDGYDKESIIRAGKVLAKLCTGRVYITLPEGVRFPKIEGCEIVRVQGPHPAGVVGFQIAKIAPVNKGDTVWTADLKTFLRIGELFHKQRFDFKTLVAVTGPALKSPFLAAAIEGSDVESILKGHLKDDGRKKRIISGNVLSGIAVGFDGFLRRPGIQLSVIYEGDDVTEFMGWASVSPKKMSVWNALPFRKLRKQFSPDARLNGGRRAMIMSGEYDRVFPADIMPEYLIKAILSRNIDDMEGLGIYEVAPEDFALCEYLDSSKMPLQQIVRDGLDFLYKELH